MGIFDNLFGNFTGETSREAAHEQRQYFDRLQSDIGNRANRYEDRALTELDRGLTGGMDSLQGYFNNAMGDIRGGYGDALSSVRDYGGQAIGGLRPIANRLEGDASSTSRLSADAMGLNGPEGIARARAAFQTGPGFNFAMEQGLDAISRNANAAGMLASGNQLQEAQRFGTGLAQQEYNNWLGRVGQREALYNPLSLQAGTTLGNLQRGVGQDISGIQTGGADARARLGALFGPAQANLQATLAGQRANVHGQSLATMGNLASNIAQPYASTWSNEAAAMNRAGQNTANLGSNILGSLVGAFF